MFVVRRFEVVLRRTHFFDAMAKLVHRIAREHEGRGEQREGAPFPLFVEHRLVHFGVDGPEAVHAAQVMDSVHGLFLFRSRGSDQGALALVTPIIESRVTSSASCASLIFSVPGGRSGKTR